jgi:hypothetical protein
VARQRFRLFEIPSAQGVVRIELRDGSMGIYDPDGATPPDICIQYSFRRESIWPQKRIAVIYTAIQ